MEFRASPHTSNITMDIGSRNATMPLDMGELYPPKPPQMGKLWFIALYLFPCLLAFGIPMNIVTVLVFMRTKLRKATTVHYFIACAITDSIHLCACLFPWLEEYSIWIYSMEGICQIVVYIRHLSDFLSSWYLALALLDVWIGHLYSTSAKRYCTVFKTRALILSVLILSLVALLYLTWTYGSIPLSGLRYFCKVIDAALDAMAVLSVMRIVFGALIPTVFIFVMTILLLVTCCRRHKDRTVATNRESVFIPLQPHRTAQAQNSERLKLSRNCLTSTCLILGMFFMLTVVPRSVIILRLTFLNYQMQEPPSVQLQSLGRLTCQLYNIHFAWKFIVYFLVLKPFRIRLWSYICCKRKRGARANRDCVVDGDLV